MTDEPYPLVQTWNAAKGRFEWVESEPDRCPACGTTWKTPGTMLRGHHPCGTHSGHRTWTCRSCDARTLNPPPDGTCT